MFTIHRTQNYVKTFIFYFRTRNDLAELVARLEKEINGGITKDLTDIHSSTCKLYKEKRKKLIYSFEWRKETCIIVYW